MPWHKRRRRARSVSDSRGGSSRITPLPESDAKRVADAAGFDDLARYCAEIGISPRVSPGLDEDGPEVDLEGERRYTVGDELGRGGGGVVRLAADRNLLRSVALKSLAREHSESALHVQAFLEEAIITGGLEHPNIVPAYELGVRPGEGLYYTMKRLDGQALSHILERLRERDPEYTGHFTIYRLLGFFIEICRALIYAHGRGVIHSDLKPENVVIGAYGEVTVVDWGLAQVLGPDGVHQARARMRAGTPEYMAPEQITHEGRELDVRADVWALGVILYELLTLSQPFVGESARETAAKVLLEPLEPPSTRAPRRGIPKAIEEVVARALHKQPEFRYVSVAEMLWDIDAYLAGAREQMRQAELAQRTVDQVEAILAGVSNIEQDLELLEKAAGAEQDEDSQTLEMQHVLADAYQQGVHHLRRAFRTVRRAPMLEECAAGLYWRIFTNLYPGRSQAPRVLAQIGSDMLMTLGVHALAAIVRVGTELARARGHVIDESDNPWLAIVRTLTESSSGDATRRGISTIARFVSRIAFLRSIPMFERIPDHNLLPVCEACEERSFEVGEVIFAQGERGDALCVIVDGSVSIVRDGAELNTCGPHSCVGEIAVLGETTRTASVVARTRTVGLILAADRFRAIAVENGALAMGLVAILNERLHVAMEREAALRSLTNTLLEPKPSGS